MGFIQDVESRSCQRCSKGGISCILAPGNATACIACKRLHRKCIFDSGTRVVPAHQSTTKTSSRPTHRLDDSPLDDHWHGTAFRADVVDAEPFHRMVKKKKIPDDEARYIIWECGPNDQKVATLAPYIPLIDSTRHDGNGNPTSLLVSSY